METVSFDFHKNWYLCMCSDKKYAPVYHSLLILVSILMLLFTDLDLGI